MDRFNDFDDLSELCTASQEKNGVWVPVELYGRSMNIKALVYGETSDAVQKFQKEKLRKQMKNLNMKQRGGRLDFDEDGLEEVVSDDGVDTALIRLGGLARKDGTALKFDGKEVPVEKNEASEDIYSGLLRGMPELADFIMRVAKDREYFLPEKKGNSNRQ
jgi:hypothetical protein